MNKTIEEWLCVNNYCASVGDVPVLQSLFLKAVNDILELDKYSVELQEAVNDQVNLVIKQGAQISTLKNSLEHAEQRVMEVSFKLLDRDKEIESLQAENARLLKLSTPKHGNLFAVFIEHRLPCHEYFASNTVELKECVRRDYPDAPWFTVIELDK